VPGAAPHPEAVAGPSPAASVVLDIGPHAGALVVHAPAHLAGAEIELRPAGGAWEGVHTAVRPRHAGGRVLHAGVFGSLPAGPYELRLRAGGGSGPVTGARVVAGTVAQAALDPGVPGPPA